MHYKAYQTTLYSIVAAAAQLIYARANTRLNSVMLSFIGPSTDSMKDCNRFYLDPTNTLKMRCQIGENSYPDNAISSASEFYHRLLHATGSANSAAHSPCITSSSFGDQCFIAFQDFEACPHMAAGTGANTFNSQLSIQLEGMGTAPNLPTACTVTSYHDVVLEITASGVTVAV